MQVESFATLAEAAQQVGTRDQYIAGGTLVMREVNFRPHTVDRLLRSTDPGLRDIRSEGGRIRIGAGATMSQVIQTTDLSALAPVARSIGGPAVRNMATVGGNLFADHPYGDFTTALLALDAEIVWADGRTQPIEAFLAQRAGQRGLVAAVLVPRVTSGQFRYAKVSRTRPKGVSVMSLAAWLPGAPGRIEGARIAFGAMGPTPLRAKAAEAALQGASLDLAGIQRALDSCCDGLSPADDPLASAWYRREVAPIHLKRLLLQERIGA